MNNYSTAIDLLIKDEMEGNPHHEFVLNLGPTPDYLIEHCGFQQLPMAIKSKVVSKACFDHGIATSQLKRLDHLVGQAKSAYRPANLVHSDSVVLVTIEMHNLLPIVIPVRKNQQLGRERFNLVLSVYGKEGHDPVKRWNAQGLHLWTRPTC